jgi:hypothetical protein
MITSWDNNAKKIDSLLDNTVSFFLRKKVTTQKRNQNTVR